MPEPRKTTDSDENITFQYMLVIQIFFWVAVFQAILFIPSLKSSTVQSLQTCLFVPDVVLFIVLNWVVLHHASKACNGEYITAEEADRIQGYLPREEAKFLGIALIA